MHSPLIEPGVNGTFRRTIPAYIGITLPVFLTGKNQETTGVVGFEKAGRLLQSFIGTDKRCEVIKRQETAACTGGVQTAYWPRPVEKGILVSGDSLHATGRGRLHGPLLSH